MLCDRVRELLMDYVAEELPEQMSEQVRGHLAACQLCQTELEMARKASGLLTLLGHQEETQGVIRVPAVAVKRGVTWQRPARLQLLGALVLVIAICIVGGGILRSHRSMPSVVRAEQPIRTVNKSTAPMLPRPLAQQSVAEHTGTMPRPSVRVPETHVRRKHKTHIALGGSSKNQCPDKPVVTDSRAKPVQAIAEILPSSLPSVDELPEGAIMMVSVKWPSRSEITDGSYSYSYRKYDPESGVSIECRGSRNRDSVDIRIHAESAKEQVKGEVPQ